MKITGSKKNLQMQSHDLRLNLLDYHEQKLSIVKQCELLGINRSTYYYKERPENEDNIKIKNLIDVQYTKTPFYGRRKMTLAISEQVEFEVNEKRIARLMREMGIEAIYPKRNLSKANIAHEKYPYLLKGLEIVKPNQVWSTDITYVRLAVGFAYLVAIIDWYSRAIISWRLSNILTADFCIETLKDALQKSKPEIMNSDQGVQFTCEKWVSTLKTNSILISMDGRGRAYDNIFIERLWRTVKYENIYPQNYLTMTQARDGLGEYFCFYNNERRHQSLNYKTPFQVHTGMVSYNGLILME